MGKTIFIRDTRFGVKPLKSRVEAIQKLKPPMMIKGCRCILGMVNFVSIFCLELQKLLKVIYDLTRKGRQFIWGEQQQKAFEEIKGRLKDHQFYTYLTDKKGFNCTLTLANLLLVVCCTKFRMDSQSHCI